MLKYVVEHGIIEESYIQTIVDMAKRDAILKQHKYKISQGRDGKWRTYLPIDGTDGRKMIKRSTRESLEDVVIQYYKNQEKNTFKDRFEIWMQRQKNCGRSDNTISKYESDYRRFFEGDPITNRDIKSISDEDLNLFIQRLLKEKEIPYRALKAMFGYINGVFEKSIIDKIITENPCKYIDLPIYKKDCTELPKKTNEERTLSAIESKALLQKLKNDETITKFAVEFSMYTGMRVGEISGLKWSDIDNKNGFMTICRSEKYNRKKKEYYISTTKNDRIRKIPLTENMLNVLNRIKKYEIGNGTLGEFVFNDQNGRVHARRISSCARNHTLTREFSSVKSIHAIRRTLNSNLRCKGVSPTVAAALLGHTERVNNENYTYDVTTLEEKKSYMESATAI